MIEIAIIIPIVALLLCIYTVRKVIKLEKITYDSQREIVYMKDNIDYQGVVHNRLRKSLKY